MIDAIASGRRCAELNVGIAMVRRGSSVAILGKLRIGLQ
jgi:hypothetical protein